MRIHAKRLTSKLKKAVINRYKAGTKGISTLAYMFGISDWSVRKILTEAGLRSRNYRPWTEEDQQSAEQMHKEGLSIFKIAETLGRHIGTVQKHLGIKKRAMTEYLSEIKKNENDKNPMTLDEFLNHPGHPLGSFNAEVGQVFSCRPLGGELTVKLEYLGKKSKHHMFRSVKGGWITAYTDAQLLDTTLTEVQ